MNTLRILCLIALAAVVWPTAGQAKLYLTRDAGLALAFGDSATVTTRTAYLDADQVEAIARRAVAPFSARRVTYYIGRAPDGTHLGHAYIETHRIRSLTETIMVVVDRKGRAARIEVLAFNEPEDYLAPPGWRHLLEGADLDRPLAPGHDLPNLSGATLTARALAAGVRRQLAIHAILEGVVTRDARP